MTAIKNQDILENKRIYKVILPPISMKKEGKLLLILSLFLAMSFIVLSQVSFVSAGCTLNAWTGANCQYPEGGCPGCPAGYSSHRQVSIITSGCDYYCAGVSTKGSGNCWTPYCRCYHSCVRNCNPSWGSWGSCSGGVQYRYDGCGGSQSQSCCSPSWGAWSACSRVCGGGVQYRYDGCGGSQSQSCNTQACSSSWPCNGAGPCTDKCDFYDVSISTNEGPHSVCANNAGNTACYIYSIQYRLLSGPTRGNCFIASTGAECDSTTPSSVVTNNVCTLTSCHPVAETCNNRDDDCDGQIDEGLSRVFSCGVGVCTRTASQSCSAGSWSPSCVPGTPVVESCDNLDNDCDGTFDEGCDDDGDDYCDSSMIYINSSLCPNGGNDTNDNNSNIHPNATEICDNIDNNQNGIIDEGCDDDSDSYADLNMRCPVNMSFRDGIGLIRICSANGGDCNDTNPAINPMTVWYLDSDGDGFGNQLFNVTQCFRPGNGTLNYSIIDSDINDSNNNTYPNATEVCDGMDNNNFAGIDEGCDYSIAINSPVNPYYTVPRVEFNATYNQNNGICGYALDGPAYLVMTETAPFNFFATNNSMTNGNHNVTFICWNSYGMINTTTVNFYVDTDTPQIQFVNPTPDSGAVLSSNELLANASYSDLYSGLANSILCFFFPTGMNLCTQSVLNSQLFGSIFGRISSLQEGTYYFNASVCDSAGNCNSTETRSAILDYTNPVVAITDPASDGLWFSDSGLDVSYSAVDSNLDSCWWTQDNGVNNNSITCNLAITNATWNEGLNLVTIYVNDSAGNVGSAARTFNIDLSAPIINNIIPSSGDIVGWTVQLRADIVDSNGISSVTYEILNNGLVLGSGAMSGIGGDTYGSTFITNDLFPYNISALDSLNLTLRVFAIDSFGHASNSSADFVLDNSAPGIQFIIPPQTGDYYGVDFNLDIYVSNHLLNFSSYSITDAFGTSILANSINLAQPVFNWADFINFSSLADGRYAITVYAEDSSEPVHNSNTKSSWFYIDRTLPVITINSPSGNYNTNMILFNITLNEPVAECNYSLDGIDYASLVSLDSINFIDVNLSMDQGTHSVTFNCIDHMGNSNSATSVFFVDSIPPLVQFESPTEISGSVLNKDEIIANASATDANLISITINLYNSLGLVNFATNFLSPVYNNFSGLPEDTYYLNATACDGVGNCQSTETRIVILDRTSPNVDITYPDNANYTRLVNELNYSILDSNIDSCWMTNDFGVINVSVICSANSVTITSLEGVNTITLYANDSAGNINSDTAVFFIDSIAPSIQFESPTEISGSVYNRTNIFANASASDTDLASITINLYNLAGLVSSVTNPTSLLSNDFTGLLDGIYYLNATACDTAGNCQSTETRNITIDTGIPVIIIGSPVNGGRYNDSMILVNITADHGDISISNGTDFWINQGIFVLNFSQGSNTLFLRANDSAGNSVDQNITFFVDSIYPSLVIVNPSNDGGSFNTTSLSVDYIVSDNLGLDSCWWTLNGGSNTPIACGNNITGPWIDGTYNVAVFASDGVNNIASDSVTFTIDTVSPFMTINSPNSGYHRNSNVTFDVTLNENGSCMYSLDGVLGLMPNLEGNHSSFLNTATSEGNHSVFFICNDTAGNTVQSLEVNFTVDTIAPTLEIISPISAVYTEINATLNVSSDGDTILYIWNGILYPYNGPVEINFTDGVINLTVYAYDLAGNVNATSVFFNVVISKTIEDSWIYTYYYPLNSTYQVVNTAVSDSTVNKSSVNGTIVSISNSYLFNASLMNATVIDYCTVLNSKFSSGVCLHTFIDPSDVTANDVTGSIINDSFIYYYNITWSNITNSTIWYSYINNSAITNSIIWYSNIFDSIVLDSRINYSTVIGSLIRNSFINNSRIFNSTIDSSTVLDSNISDSLIYRSMIIGSQINLSRINDSTIISSNIYNSEITRSNITGSNVINSTVIDSTILNSSIIRSMISGSNITRSNITDSTVINSTITDSTVTGSNITRSNITDSTVINSTITDSTVTGSNITRSNITDSTVINSTIIDSIIINSTIIRSQIINSTIINSTIIDSTVTNSSVINSFVNVSNITGSTIINSSIINMTIINSTIVNSNLSNANVTNANITDNIICNGTITFNGTTYDADADGCRNLTQIINYPPTAVLTLDFYDYTMNSTTISGESSTDLNLGSSWERLYCEIDFGDGTPLYSGCLIAHNYTVSGIYNVSLKVTDLFGEYSFDNKTIAIAEKPVRRTGGGGGGCITPWNCSAWSPCSVGGAQIRNCTKIRSYCFGGTRPNETQACNYSAPPVVNNVPEIIEPSPEEILKFIQGRWVDVEGGRSSRPLWYAVIGIVIFAGIAFWLYYNFKMKPKSRVQYAAPGGVEEITKPVKKINKKARK
jgi:uncharacterized protein YjbI with pentapeptide repeats